MIKKYQDKNLLEKKYCEEKLSTYQIGKLCEVNQSTIWDWLKKFDIPRRSRGEGVHLTKANHCNLSKEAIEWINGELLGDGCLYSYSTYSASFRYSSKYEEYIKYISDTLKSFGIEQIGKINRQCHNNSYTYHYSSREYEELLSIREKWYPNNKKIVPKNIKLTPTTLRQHFIGDGCLQHRKKRRPRIKLSTYGFLISDVEWLVKQLIKLGFKAKRQASNAIGISTYSTKDFLDYIGKCPVKCYEYKFLY